MKRGAERGRRGLSRSTWAAVEVWSLTTLAHTAAGGALPTLPWLVGLAVLVLAASALVLRASVSTWVVLPALAASQVALHLALSSMPSISAPATSMSHAHQMGGDASTAVMASPGLTWPMVAAHLASALLTAAVWRLRRRAVETLDRLAAPWGRSLTTITVLLPRWTQERSPQRVWLIGSPRRGPPRSLAAA